MSKRRGRNGDARRPGGRRVEPHDRRRVAGGGLGATPRGRAHPAAGDLPAHPRRAVGARLRDRVRLWGAAGHARGSAARPAAARAARPFRAGAAATAVRSLDWRGRLRRRHAAHGRMRRLLLLLGGLLGSAFLLAAPALAHATLVTSDPTDGARLQTVPHTVTLTFEESVGIGGIGYLHVTDQSGRRVDARASYHRGGDATKV